MEIQSLIRQVSRELYAATNEWFGKTKTMTDDDWRKVIDDVNAVCERYALTDTKEYAIRYGACLLDELDRQAKKSE